LDAICSFAAARNVRFRTIAQVMKELEAQCELTANRGLPKCL
jgi:hypothetical protein